MTKQEYIKLKWGKCYNSIYWSKGFDSNDGWMKYNSSSPRLITDGENTVIKDFEDIEIDIDGFDTPQFGFVISAYRPKSLRGIETNNGWTKIES